MAPGELEALRAAPERNEGSLPDGKRLLALFQISKADDLGMALGRLFLPGNPERERLAAGRCFARYVVIEDATQRSAAYAALQRWMAASAKAVSGIANAVTTPAFAADTASESSNEQAQIGPPTPIPSGF
jgi:hypothetical protein